MARERVWTDAIEGLLLAERDATFDVEMLPPDKAFMAASKVTLFVGANNVGKSRFMRRLATSKGLTIQATEVGWRGDPRAPSRDLADAIAALLIKADKEFAKPIPQHLQQHAHHVRNAEADWKSRAGAAQYPYDRQARNARIDFAKPDALIDAKTVEPVFQLSSLRADSVLGQDDYVTQFRALAKQAGSAKPLQSPKRTYIPVLRGLRSVDREGETRRYGDNFERATVHDYALEGVAVETGLGLFGDVREKLLGKRNERETVRRYEDFLSKNFFEGRPLTLTPHEKEQVLNVDLDGDEHPIHLVGDGMQSVIVMTYRAFVTQDTPGIFFIEEPELFLHPGMQRRLLHYFLHETPHLYFITTHSNHLLELSMDECNITVHNFRRVLKPNPTGKGPSVSVTEVRRVNGGDRSSLALLGVRASSVFLVNATVWVEGVTDRRYLREMIRLYVVANKEIAGFRRMEEDIHYSFVEYGGSNITHLSFMKHKDEDHPIDVGRLCANGMLMIDVDDSDTPGKNKHRRREELEVTLGPRLVVTAGREVENMLPERVIHAVMRQFKEDDAACAKVTRAGYRNRLLGTYLEEQLAGIAKRKSWREKSGTIVDKVEFCERALGVMRDSEFKFEHLPDEVQTIVKRIYDFILKQNEGGAAA